MLLYSNVKLHHAHFKFFFVEPKIFVTVELWRTHINEPLGISLMERKYVYITVMHVFSGDYSCKPTWLSPIAVFGRIVLFPGTSVSS